MFRKKTITLDNGHTVVQPANWTPLIALIVLLILWGSSILTNFDPSVIFTKAPVRIVMFFERLFPMNTAYFSRIWVPVAQTLAMSFLGTVIGAILAFPTMYFVSSNLNSNKFVLYPLRIILSIIRTIPITVYAIVFALIFGLSSFVGMLAIAIFTYSILTKMMYDYIETVDMSAHEALMATGASKFKAYWVAILPQILGIFLSQFLYNFEMNVRSSAILGYVGAGGIGYILDTQMKLQKYDNATPILIALLVTVLVVEFVSRSLRKRLS